MCPLTPETPTTIARMTGRIGLFLRLLDPAQPESTKRFLALISALTLCGCLVVLTLAVWYQALVFERVDGNLVAALGLISASVAGLAGSAYRKPEGGTP